MSNELHHDVAKELDRLEAEVRRTHRALEAKKGNATLRAAAAKAVGDRDRLVLYMRKALKLSTRQRRGSHGSRSGSRSYSSSGSRTSHGSRGGRRTKLRCRS